MFLSFERLLGGSHDLVRIPDEYVTASYQRQLELASDLLENCDVVVGGHRLAVLEARAAHRRQVPLIENVLGDIGRGASEISVYAALLRTSDLLVVNSTADADAARMFFDAPRFCTLPLSVDTDVFRSLVVARRVSVSSAFGLIQHSRFVIHSGRIV